MRGSSAHWKARFYPAWRDLGALFVKDVQGFGQFCLEYRAGGGEQGGDVPPALALPGHFMGSGAASGEVAGVLSEDHGFFEVGG